MAAWWGQQALALGALASAGALGWLLWNAFGRWRRRQRHRFAVVGESDASDDRGDGREGGAAAQVCAFATGVSKRLESPLFRPLAPPSLRGRPWPEALACMAGLADALTGAGFWESRVRLAAAGAVAGGVAGLLVSGELGCLLGCAGAVAGWQLLPWALRREADDRARAMERDLSEMLSVVALGLRSGLSFERSLGLYTGYFKNHLARAFQGAERQWSCGLASRADALRAVAASYASPLLGRVVENIVRSLRFGATLADNLEDAAREARADYKARRQEEVAKAPVKMMVPTGVLILPAMLMLVLGPVLLELAAGF